MMDALSIQTSKAFLNWLKMYYGPTLEQLPPDTAIWISLERGKSRGQPLGIGAIADVCEKYLGTSRVHATRHTFAHGMDQVGASVSEIQARLGHESLATTGQYLSRLKSAENKHAERLAALFGIE